MQTEKQLSKRTTAPERMSMKGKPGELKELPKPEV